MKVDPFQDQLYPCTIVVGRYGGFYAFNLFKDDIPQEIFGGDDEAHDFIESGKEIIGMGMTPDKAYLDLLDKLNKKKD